MSSPVTVIDAPPAGTECAHCRSKGRHYCPAKAYFGTTDVPVCLECWGGKPCSVEVATAPAEDEELFDPTPPPVRSVPQSEWPKDLPAERVIRERGWSPSLPKVTIDAVGEKRVAATEEITAPAKDLELSRQSPQSLAKKREEAAALLLSGKSTRDVARRTGLAKNTVSSVRRGLDDLPPANRGGWPRHKDVRDDAQPEPRVTPKEAQRQIAREVFEKGGSTRDAIEQSGLAYETVKKVRNGIPSLPPLKSTNSGKGRLMLPGDETRKRRIVLHPQRSNSTNDSEATQAVESVLDSPSCSNDNYDAVIADIDGKILALQQARATLAVLRGGA